MKQMKTVIKEAVIYKDIKKYLPKCYSDMLPSNFGTKEGYINLVIFPFDRKGVITSRYIQKALQKIKDSTILTIYFAYCLSTEAKALIREHNGLIFDIDNFEWTDESWFIYKNGY